MTRRHHRILFLNKFGFPRLLSFAVWPAARAMKPPTGNSAALSTVLYLGKTVEIITGVLFMLLLFFAAPITPVTTTLLYIRPLLW